jgi:hypothetical protein
MRSESAGVDPLRGFLVCLSLLLDLRLAGVTFTWAMAHEDFSGLPFDLWVVLFEPGESKDHVLLQMKCVRSGH